MMVLGSRFPVLGWCESECECGIVLGWCESVCECRMVSCSKWVLGESLNFIFRFSIFRVYFGFRISDFNFWFLIAIYE